MNLERCRRVKTRKLLYIQPVKKLNTILWVLNVPRYKIRTKGIFITNAPLNVAPTKCKILRKIWKYGRLRILNIVKPSDSLHGAETDYSTSTQLTFMRFLTCTQNTYKNRIFQMFKLLLFTTIIKMDVY